ncbi:uncharacterized protein LOC141813907 [Curcuma longa]|uniref:uncharacterized protein LOC141813907 n=1 Tax=Curcuma longa TaxID=136217 RepID=UPI003D9ED750
MCLDFTAPLLCSSGVSESHLSSMGWRGSSTGVMALKVALLCCLSFCVFSLFNLTEGNSRAISACSEATSWRRHSDYKAAADVAGGGRKKDRLLMGPGSRPPRCTSRCGTCTPCYPVHVSVPPRQQQKADAAEYYPEAWRCRCRGRLYVP